MNDLNKKFDEFWMEYQTTTDFARLWGDITEYQRFSLIAQDFVKWLILKEHIKEKND